MILATCIRKYETGGKITKYAIKNLKGQVVMLEKDKLKEAIKNNIIDLNNLRLSKDGRLISREEGYYKYKSTFVGSLKGDLEHLGDKGKNPPHFNGEMNCPSYYVYG